MPSHALPKQATSLYHDPVSENFEDEPIKKPTDTATTVDNARRGNDFGAHYSMADAEDPSLNGRPGSRGQRSDMEQHWSFDTPPAERKIYKTAGDGMGNRKGTSADDQSVKQYKTQGDGMGGRKAATGRSWWEYGDEIEEVPEVRAGARSQRTRA